MRNPYNLTLPTAPHTLLIRVTINT